jgi:hypothetical protein
METKQSTKQRTSDAKLSHHLNLGHLNFYTDCLNSLPDAYVEARYPVWTISHTQTQHMEHFYSPKKEVFQRGKDFIVVFNCEPNLMPRSLLSQTDQLVKSITGRVFIAEVTDKLRSITICLSDTGSCVAVIGIFHFQQDSKRK